ncbi:MAG TPA: Fic family protein [Solirubrobacteraceae bacterium]|nr:Fic family protein [Solirubrobacteraceae bacterium]
MPSGRPSRQQVIADFDRALNDLWAVGGLPSPWESEGIWDDIWQEETHHSTAMEGNTLVLRQVKVLLDEGRAVGNKELREYLEIEGYAAAAKWVYDQAIRRNWEVEGATPPGLVSLTDLREIHTLVMGPVWRIFPPEGAGAKEGPGGFRECEVESLREGFRPPPSITVRPQLDQWLEVVGSGPQRGAHFLEYLADAHASFERVHPFRDGNGRVGRLVMNLLLVRNGAPPAILDKRVRAKYLRSLERADNGEPGPLAELLARSARDSVERFLLPALAGPQRLVPLRSLASELSHQALLSAAKRGRLQATKIGGGWYSSQHHVNEYRDSRQQGRRLPRDRPPRKRVPTEQEQPSGQYQIALYQ